MVETEGSRQSSRSNKGQPAKRLAEDNSSSESEFEPTYKQQPKKKKGPKTNDKKTNSPPTTKEDSVPKIINPPSANASNDINTQPSHDAHDNKSINDDDDNNNDDDDDDNETSTAATLYNVTGEVLFNTIATSAVGNDAFATAATIANLSPDRSALTPTLTATIAKETATTKRASTAKHTSKKKDVAVSASKKSRKHQRRTKWDNDIKNDEGVRKGWVKLSSDGMTIDCRLCDSVFNARQPFSGASYMGVKGHKDSRKFRSLLMAKTMDDIVVASNEGMQCLQIKKNETGSTTGNQKFKSLSGRWYVKEEAKHCSNNADVGVSSGSGGEKRSNAILVCK